MNERLQNSEHLLGVGAQTMRPPPAMRLNVAQDTPELGMLPKRAGTVKMMGEVTEIMMPALSSTMTEGKISQWLINVGDKVEVGDMVLVVESDKADMDVESYEEGYLAAILTDEGETAAVGAPVAALAVNEADIEAVAAAAKGGAVGGAAPAPAAAAPAPAPASAPVVNTGRIVASPF